MYSTITGGTKWCKTGRTGLTCECQDHGNDDGND